VPLLVTYIIHGLFLDHTLSFFSPRPFIRHPIFLPIPHYFQYILYQRCPSWLKCCHCRTATLEKRSYRAAAATRRLIEKSCCDAMAYKLAAAAIVFKKLFQVSLPRLYRIRNIGTRPSDSFSLRVFHL